MAFQDEKRQAAEARLRVSRGRALNNKHICADCTRLSSNAHMSDEKAQRVDDALSSLVDILIPILPDEDEAIADERHDDALELARSIIEG